MAEVEEEDLLAQLDIAPPEAKKFPLMKALLAVMIFALVGGGGYFAYTQFFAGVLSGAAGDKSKAKETAKSGTESGEEDEGDLGVMYSLDPFIVNLAASQGKRFLKVTVALELSALEIRNELKENEEKIMDSILILLSSKTFEDVYSIQGKFKIKDEIATRVNRFLVLGHIKDVYFSEFVIQ